VLFLALKVGNLSSAHLSNTYVLQAKFDNIGGLKVRGPVKSAGVVVGRITDIKFDPATYEAVVTMTIDGRYQFPKDTFAADLHGWPARRAISSALMSAVTKRC
jgi:phospholipid/cholesterol/gamma-HCH transport system substrate-binding protein